MMMVDALRNVDRPRFLTAIWGLARSVLCFRMPTLNMSCKLLRLRHIRGYDVVSGELRKAEASGRQLQGLGLGVQDLGFGV